MPTLTPRNPDGEIPDEEPPARLEFENGAAVEFVGDPDTEEWIGANDELAGEADQEIREGVDFDQRQADYFEEQDI